MTTTTTRENKTSTSPPIPPIRRPTSAGLPACLRGQAHRPGKTALASWRESRAVSVDYHRYKGRICSLLGKGIFERTERVVGLCLLVFGLIILVYCCSFCSSRKIQFLFPNLSQKRVTVSVAAVAHVLLVCSCCLNLVSIVGLLCSRSGEGGGGEPTRIAMTGWVGLPFGKCEQDGSLNLSVSVALTCLRVTRVPNFLFFQRTPFFFELLRVLKGDFGEMVLLCGEC